MAAHGSHWSGVDVPMNEDAIFGADMIARVQAIGDDEAFSGVRWWMAQRLETLIATDFENLFGVTLGEFMADLKQRTSRGESPARVLDEAFASALRITAKEMLELAPHLRKRMRRRSVTPVAVPSLLSAAGALPIGGRR